VSLVVGSAGASWQSVREPRGSVREPRSRVRESHEEAREEAREEAQAVTLEVTLDPPEGYPINTFYK